MKIQRGDISIVVIMIALLIGGLVLLQFANKTPSTQNVQNPECISPNPGVTITYGSPPDNVYYRIRNVTAMPTGEIEEHLVTSDNKIYTVRSGVTYDSGAVNLLFVDVSDEVANKMPGFKYFIIYLKQGKDIPNFINEFCNSNQPLSPRSIMPDASGNSFPPTIFNTNEISQSDDPKPPSNIKYYLFSYEGEGSASWRVTMSSSQKGSIRVSANGTTKTYTTYFNNGSTIKYIALVDDDPNSPDSKVAYKYTSADHLPVDSPTPTSSYGAPKKSLQLRTFSNLLVYPWGWWSPECKPAIYLYPKEKTNISVKVKPAGFLTYADPKYPSDGWKVFAEPGGKIITNGKDYEYLYYESKIKDSEINKPKEGFVLSFNELPAFYDQILPKLGLNEKEIKDFKNYWEKVLPQSPYYFVGIMSDNSIEKIEPLTVDPKPESVIRVRLYFEALDKKISVNSPEIKTPSRSGYTLVEWGGLVKTDSAHPFTCSQ